MSNKDETDLVRNKELTTTAATMEQSLQSLQSLKSNSDVVHDQSNGSASPVNFDNSTSSGDKDKQSAAEIQTKPTTPSNWVQFDNDDDDSDKVSKRCASAFNDTKTM